MKTVLVSVNNCGSLHARCTSPCLLVYDFCKPFLLSDSWSFCPVQSCLFPKQEVLLVDSLFFIYLFIYFCE